MDNMIGIRIREMRNKQGLTPKDIKELTGIGSGHLSELENSKKFPSTPTLIKLAQLFNCTTDWILFGETHNCESHDASIPTRESEIMCMYKELDPDDQTEIYEIMALKLKLKEKRKKSSPSDVESNSGIA